MSAEDVLQIRCESNARFWERRRDRHFRLWPGCDDGPSNDAEWNYFREGMNVWGEHLTEVVRIYERRMYMVYPDRANRPGWLTPGSGLLKARLFVAADAYIRPLHDPDWIVAMTHEWLQVGTLLVREGESDHKA